MGIRKTQRINRLCRMLEEQKKDYSRKDLEQLSLGQLTKRIKELGGTFPKYERRSGGDFFSSD